MIDPNRVLDFIDHFTQAGDRKQVIECFTCGNCFWFAYILHGRFSAEPNVQCEIMYDEVENHFATKIDNEIYDITGIVTNQYDWIAWSDLWKKDPSLSKRIVRDCVKQETIEDE